jgi:hypothetical protein
MLALPFHAAVGGGGECGDLGSSGWGWGWGGGYLHYIIDV